MPTASSATTSNGESTSSTPNVTDELKISSQLRKFNFNELKLATRSFRPESLLGEGGFGCVFKGWVSENGTAPVKPGTGLSVAVKTLNHDGLQGHKEWLVCPVFIFYRFLNLCDRVCVLMSLLCRRKLIFSVICCILIWLSWSVIVSRMIKGYLCMSLCLVEALKIIFLEVCESFWICYLNVVLLFMWKRSIRVVFY